MQYKTKAKPGCMRRETYLYHTDRGLEKYTETKKSTSISTVLDTMARYDDGGGNEMELLHWMMATRRMLRGLYTNIINEKGVRWGWEVMTVMERPRCRELDWGLTIDPGRRAPWQEHLRWWRKEQRSGLELVCQYPTPGRGNQIRSNEGKAKWRAGDNEPFAKPERGFSSTWRGVVTSEYSALVTYLFFCPWWGRCRRDGPGWDRTWSRIPWLPLSHRSG